jgi:hypothetical protein
MVPFSYFQGLINSRGMKDHSSTIEVWTFDAWSFAGASSLGFGAFALSCFLAFLILILAPVVCLYSVLLRLCDRPVFLPLAVAPKNIKTTKRTQFNNCINYLY